MDPQHWLQGYRVPDGGLLSRVGVDERTHQEFNSLARVQNLRLQREIIHQHHPGPANNLLCKFYKSRLGKFENKKISVLTINNGGMFSKRISSTTLIEKYLSTGILLL